MGLCHVTKGPTPYMGLPLVTNGPSPNMGLLHATKGPTPNKGLLHATKGPTPNMGLLHAMRGGLKGPKRQYSGQMSQIFKTVKTMKRQQVRLNEVCEKYKVRKIA